LIELAQTSRGLSATVELLFPIFQKWSIIDRISQRRPRNESQTAAQKHVNIGGRRRITESLTAYN